MRVVKESIITGMLFIFFILLIIRSALMRKMISSGLIRKYSLEKMILELEKLHVDEDFSGSINEPERTRKQKDSLKHLKRYRGGRSMEIRIYLPLNDKVVALFKEAANL